MGTLRLGSSVVVPSIVNTQDFFGIPRVIDVNGRLIAPDNALPDTRSATKIGPYCFAYAYYNTALRLNGPISFPNITEVQERGFSNFNRPSYSRGNIAGISFPDLISAQQYSFENFMNLQDGSVYGNSLADAIIDFHSLVTAGQYAFQSAFTFLNRGEGTNIAKVDFSSLITANISAFASAFFRTVIKKADFSSLETVSTNGFNNAFYESYLQEIDLSSVHSLGSSALAYAFYRCSLTSLSFPALTSTGLGSYTNQFNNMLSGVTGCIVHFPSNLQSIIGNWSDVQNGFGGSNTQVLFDLPATE